jgi:hypothetical protein
MSLYIPPSSLLGALDSKKISSLSRRFENTPLRLGVISRCFELDDPNNLSKLVPEYEVITKESNENGIRYVKYSNCLSADGFGGIADFFEYKMRPTKIAIDKDPEKVSHDFKKQNGTLVLLLCLDGFSEKALIIGGFSNVLDQKKQRKTTLTKENGLHLEGEYNGLNWQINKNGEFTLTFRSPTDNDGKIIDKKYSGTYAKIDKTGSFEVKDSKNSTRMDNDKGGISSSTKGSYSVNAENNIENKATKDINESATNWKIELTGSATQKAASWAVEVSGEAKLKVGGALNIEASSTVLKSKSKVGIETNMLDVKGKSINLEGKQVQVGGAGGTPAVTMKTKFMGIGNLGAPVISTAIGPFSSVVFIK